MLVGAPTVVGGVVPNGQGASLQMDANGNLLVNVAVPATVTIGSQVTTIINSTAAATIVTAGAAGIFNDITGFQITNQSATAVTVTINDGTSNRKIYDLAANGGIVVPFANALPQAVAARNWTAALSINTVTVDVNVDFIATAQAGV